MLAQPLLLELQQANHGQQRPKEQVRKHAHQGQACGGAADEEACLLLRIFPTEDSTGIVALEAGHPLEHADGTLQGVQNLYDRTSLNARTLVFYLAHIPKPICNAHTRRYGPDARPRSSICRCHMGRWWQLIPSDLRNGQCSARHIRFRDMHASYMYRHGNRKG